MTGVERRRGRRRRALRAGEVYVFDVATGAVVKTHEPSDRDFKALNLVRGAALSR